MISIKNLTKKYAERTVLDNVNLSISKGDKVGIVGENGAGKTTLLLALLGELDYHGSIDLHGQSTAYIAQSPQLNLKNTVQEELLDTFKDVLKLETQMRALEQQMSDPSVYEDTSRFTKVSNDYQALQDDFAQKGGFEVESRIEKVFNNLNLTFSKDQVVKSLSGGQKSLLALAKVLVQDFDIFLMDEPTNHLDVVRRQGLEDYLRASKKTLLVVSHDRYFLDQVVTKIVEVANGKTSVYNGNYSVYVEKKAKRFQEQLSAFEKQQTNFDKRKKAMESFKSGHPKFVAQYKSKKRLLEKMDLMDKPTDIRKKIDIKLSSGQTSDRNVVRVDTLAKSFGDLELFKDLNFTIERKSKYAVLGPNGIGKTTLLRILAGHEQPSKGLVELGMNVKVGYFDQEHGHLTKGLKVVEEARSANKNVGEQAVRKTLAKLGFKGKEGYKKVESLSLGERARLMFAKLILTEANFLILDEPTNHLDLHSREVLEQALENYDGTMIFVSHDRYFIRKLCDHIIDFKQGGVTVFSGGYEAYLKKRVHS